MYVAGWLRLRSPGWLQDAWRAVFEEQHPGASAVTGAVTGAGTHSCCTVSLADGFRVCNQGVVVYIQQGLTQSTLRWY